MDRYQLKRDLFRVTGVTPYRWRTLRGGIYVFNYHRVGNAEITEFDPNVFSCDEQHFARQIELIRSRFEVINVARLLEMIDTGAKLREPFAMITFDDGYRDNYTHAFPILRASRTPAVFFLPTDFIGKSKLAWWDEIAWLLKHARNRDLREVPWLDGVRPQQCSSRSIRDVLTAFKRSSLEVDTKLQQLRSATGCALTDADVANLFMNWDDVRSMRREGMDFGSHTHSHRILSHLKIETQHAELATSKQVLEAELGEPIFTLAYPVGNASTYTTETQSMAESSGYRAAFSFIAGVNEQPATNRFELRRIAVEENAEPKDLCFATAFAGRDPSALPGISHLKRAIQWFSSHSRKDASERKDK